MAGGANTLRVNRRVPTTWLKSVTCTVKEAFAAFAAGVPEITPAALSDNPRGSVPDARLQTSGGVPPEACNVCGTYANPRSAEARAAVVTSGAGFTINVNVRVVLLPPLAERATADCVPAGKAAAATPWSSPALVIERPSAFPPVMAHV